MKYCTLETRRNYMTKIVGHRGAAGLALENTLASIKAAKEYDVDAIEFDVRLTRDSQLVLCHDEHVARVSLFETVLAEVNFEDAVTIRLHEDHNIPSLREALKACGDTPVIIEIKDTGSSGPILEVLRDYSHLNITITTFQHGEARNIRKHNTNVKLFIAEHFSPFDIIATARSLGADGITLNAWLINPLTYWLASRYNLKIMLYTVNSRFIGRFLQRLYPDIMLCTDRPDRFIRKRRFKALAKKLQSRKKTYKSTPKK
jgi:glycerophosphoryl diester phosphodiesterase